MVEVKCATCGAGKMYRPSEAAEYKSRSIPYQCRACYIKNPRKGEQAPRWDGGSVTLTCVDCGKTTTMFKNRAKKSKSPFRCVSCYGKSKTGDERHNWLEESPIVVCHLCGAEKNVRKTQARKYRERTEPYKCFQCSLDIRPQGEGSHAWKGGLNKILYPRDFNKKLKQKIRERDGYVCQICGDHQQKRRLIPVHHIDYNKNNIENENLISLCHVCHAKTNSNRDQWKEYFRIKLLAPPAEHELPSPQRSVGVLR